MTKSLTVLDANNDQYQDWFDRTNQIIEALAQEIVTANTDANGSITTGNSQVLGIFGSTTLVANTLRGGNVQSTAALNLGSNLVVNATSTIIAGNLVINTAGIYFSGVRASFSDFVVNAAANNNGGTGKVIDLFPKATYRAADYVITIKNNEANQHQVSKILVHHDDSVAYLTEYGQLYNNGVIGTMSANVNGANVELVILPSVANVQIKAVRTSVVV